MKKIISLILMILLISSTIVYATSSQSIDVIKNRATIYVNDAIITADNFNYNGTLYVPLRTISENMGATVNWDNSTKFATITAPMASKSGISIALAKAETEQVQLLNMMSYQLLYTIMSLQNYASYGTNYEELEYYCKCSKSVLDIANSKKNNNTEYAESWNLLSIQAQNVYNYAKVMYDAKATKTNAYVLIPDMQTVIVAIVQVIADINQKMLEQ